VNIEISLEDLAEITLMTASWTDAFNEDHSSGKGSSQREIQAAVLIGKLQGVLRSSVGGTALNIVGRRKEMKG